LKQAHTTTIDRHSVLCSFLLHAAPGLATFIAYVFLFAPLTAHARLPARVGYILAITCVALPILLVPLKGSNLWRAFRHGIPRSPAFTSIGIVVALFVWAAVVSTTVGSVLDPWLQKHVFSWLPASFAASESVKTTGYGKASLIATRLASVVMVGIIVPFAEELYFRGFLLPRVPWNGATRIIIHSAMFAGFHFLSPWAFVTRMLVLLPMVSSVWLTGRLSIGIWLHCGANMLGELLLLAVVSAK